MASYDFFAWSPERHGCGTRDSRDRIVAVLATVRRKRSPAARLPLELLFYVFGLVWEAGLSASVRGVLVCDLAEHGSGNPACTAEHIFVPNAHKAGVAVYTRKGKLVHQIGAGVNGLMGGSGGVAVVGDHVLVTDGLVNRVVVFRVADGVRVRHFDTGLVPKGIAAANGLLFVAAFGQHRVEVFREDGKFVRTIGREGRGEGALREVRGLAVCNGEVFVVDAGNSRVSVFRADSGALLRTLKNPRSRWFLPQGVCVRNGMVFVTDGSSQRVVVLSALDGTHVTELGGSGVTTKPTGVCISDDGVLYVACWEGVVSFQVF